MATESTDYLALTAEHVKNPKAEVVAAIVKYCGISLNDRDGRYVAASDAEELGRIVKGYCAKKLGLSREAGAAAVAAAAQSMKGTRMKHRVPFYYLVAEHAGKLGALAGGANANGGAGLAAKPARSMASAGGATSSASAVNTPSAHQGSATAAPASEAPKSSAPPHPSTSAQAQPMASSSTASSGSSWWKWLLPILAALAALWFFMGHHDRDDKMAGKPAATETTTTAAAPAAAPAAIMVDNVDVGTNLTTAMGTLTSALPTVTDAASATAALPKLQEAGSAIAAVAGVAAKFSGDQKTAVASMVNAGLPALTDLVTKAEGNADAAGVLKPVLDAIIGNLTGLTK